MAISYTNSTNGRLNTGGTSITISFDATGSDSNTLLVVGWFQDGTSSVSGVTYNGVSMTSINSNVMPGSINTGMFYLLGPTTGSNNLVVTRNTSINTLNFVVGLYSGVRQTSQPDASINASNQVGQNPSVSITTSVANCWIIGSLFAGATFSSAGTNTFQRQTSPDSLVLTDSNGAVGAAGSKTVSWNLSSSTDYTYQISSFAPNIQNLTLVASVGTFLLTGNNITIGRLYLLIASTGSFILTGINAVLNLRGWSNQIKNTSSWTNQTKN